MQANNHTFEYSVVLTLISVDNDYSVLLTVELHHPVDGAVRPEVVENDPAAVDTLHSEGAAINLLPIVLDFHIVLSYTHKYHIILYNLCHIGESFLLFSSNNPQNLSNSYLVY